jgi:hypothetical protein
MGQQHWPKPGEADQFVSFSLARKTHDIVRIFLTNGHGDGIKVYVKPEMIEQFKKALELFEQGQDNVEVSAFTKAKDKPV